MREKIQILNQFPLKIIALLTMTIDHIGVFLYDSSNFPVGSFAYGMGHVFRCIGRLSFPLFILMLAEGLRKTHDRLNYVLRFAVLWGLITVAEVVLYLVEPSLAIAGQAFTDLLCYALFIYLIEHKNKPIRILALLPLAYMIISYSSDVSEWWCYLNGSTSVWSGFFPDFLRGGYTIYGFLMFLGIYYAPVVVDYFFKKTVGDMKDEMSEWTSEASKQGLTNMLSATSILAFTLVFWLIERSTGIGNLGMETQSWCVLSCLLVACYTGKRGWDAKWFRWFEYLFYPVHLVLIFGVFALFF